PEYLRDKSRITQVIRAIIDLSEVAGNHSRFLYDFSPDSVVFRWTNDFAPRMLYSFKMDTKGNLSLPDLIEKVKAKDIAACELYIGGSIVERLSKDDKSTLEGATIEPGVKNLVTKLENKIKKDLDIVENVPTNGE
ncbi:MAG: type I-B CRISPR-associated protein Cas7/Cst2/DevR, partial [Blastocatellia bacterium]|nr:type I-B CRISPR-associated protein Cas7/Cst2/DevR [Blastocatellia bacterium]